MNFQKWFSSQWLSTLVIMIASALTSACVSVNLGGKSGQKSSSVAFNAPTTPFNELGKTNADRAWQNHGNGNTISYYSSCNDSTDPAVEAVMHELFNEVKDLKTIKTGNRMFNGREALDTEVEGKLDGVATRIHALVFKKNGCTYTLSHIGVPKSFEEDRGRFDAFLGSFQAP